MKSILIACFVCFGFVAMAQSNGDGNKGVVFSSPEPTVIKVDNGTQTDPKERVVFTSPEPTVQKVENGNTATQPRVEFTSPEPTTVTTGKRDDK